MAATLPVDGLELCDGFLRNFKPEYLRTIKDLISRKNLAMPMMCFSPDFTVPDKTLRKKEIARQKEIIRITAELGGKYCRTLSGQNRPGIPIEEGINWVVEAIHESLETARQYDVLLVIENHYKDGVWKYREFAQKKEVFLAIVNRIDSPYFGIQYDPSNAIVAGDDPIELLEILKGRVKTMHASDRYPAPGITLEKLKESEGKPGYAAGLLHGVIGKGLNDYDRIFRILKGVNFDGWISIEDGMNGMEEMRESALFLKKKITE